jgi:NDP-sugar pyrophosphorylase family protein
MSEVLPPVAILAGGLATRLRPLTETIPKALVDIEGRPFVLRQLDLLQASGITHVVLCLGYLGEMVPAEVVPHAKRLGIHVDFSFDGPQLLGTAGALRKAAPLLGDVFFVLYGDSYLRCDYAAVASAFFASEKRGLMTVFENDNQWDSSNVEFADGRIVAYDKKLRTPRMHHIDYGLGVLSALAFEDVVAETPFDLASLYQDLVARGELAGYQVHERFHEIGSHQGLSDLRALLASS